MKPLLEITESVRGYYKDITPANVMQGNDMIILTDGNNHLLIEKDVDILDILFQWKEKDYFVFKCSMVNGIPVISLFDYHDHIKG